MMIFVREERIRRAQSFQVGFCCSFL